MATGFRGEPPPTAPGKPIYDVIAPARGETCDLTILDSLILGTMCHWVVDEKTRHAQSRLCEEFQGHCPHCATQRKLWLGWLAVLDHGRRCRAILRLGRESAVQLAARSIQFAGLRGVRLRVSRSQDTRTGSLRYEDSPLAAPSPLPDPHHIDHTICVVLGCASLPEYRVTESDIRMVPT